MREIMAISSAVVSLSQKPESFGRTVLEALSLGTPVVGYDHGGVGEVLSQVYPDGSVPVGDTDAVAAKLAAILDDPVVAGQSVRNHEFDVERMCVETLSLVRHARATCPSPQTGCRERFAMTGTGFAILSAAILVGGILLPALCLVASAGGLQPNTHSHVSHDPRTP